MVPGTPDDAVQIIDVRDLAEFIVTCIETKAVGTMNVCGPDKKLTNAAVMAGCLAASKKGGGKDDATFTYVPYEWLAENGIQPGQMPILLPPTGETGGFHTRKMDKAIKAGLKFRSAEETAAAILAWWPKAVELRTKVAKQQAEEAAAKAGKPAPQDFAIQDSLRSGIKEDKERDILNGWKLSQEKK